MNDMLINNGQLMDSFMDIFAGKKVEQILNKSTPGYSSHMLKIHKQVKKQLHIIASLIKSRITTISGDKKQASSAGIITIDLAHHIEKMVKSFQYYNDPDFNKFIYKTDIKENEFLLDIDNTIIYGMVVSELIAFFIEYFKPGDKLEKSDNLNKHGKTQSDEIFISLYKKKGKRDDINSHFFIKLSWINTGFIQDIDFFDPIVQELKLIESISEKFKGTIQNNKSQGGSITFDIKLKANLMSNPGHN